MSVIAGAPEGKIIHTPHLVHSELISVTLLHYYIGNSSHRSCEVHVHC